MALAHGVCVAVEEAPPGAWPGGREARKSAVSVASLIGEALLEARGDEVGARLADAVSRLADVRRRLDEPGFADAVPEQDRVAVLADAQLLAEDLAAALALGRTPGRGPLPPAG
ncbi:MAG: hypothetical protein EDX89_21405 [Acidobacteria bacterium]|nr:MAG: hypothetical protein EDX89_21405 [Acidobacteriota bacterium]